MGGHALCQRSERSATPARLATRRCLHRDRPLVRVESSPRQGHGLTRAASLEPTLGHQVHRVPEFDATEVSAQIGDGVVSGIPEDLLGLAR
jgi:hypothetical protein